MKKDTSHLYGEELAIQLILNRFLNNLLMHTDLTTEQLAGLVRANPKIQPLLLFASVNELVKDKPSE